MNISVPYRELFRWDSELLQRSLEAAPPDIWEKHAFRQNAFEVHRTTRSIIYVWSQPTDETYREVQTFIAEDDPADLHREVWAVAQRIRAHFGATARVTKLMLAKLFERSRIIEHTDTGNLTAIHRCHLPILTSPDCRFLIDHEAHHFDAGTVFELNNQLSHGVVNDSDRDRVHLICDVLPTG
jgi:aspartyl/asparaginyl beta-hydroxylase (cupin superfamily)